MQHHGEQRVNANASSYEKQVMGLGGEARVITKISTDSNFDFTSLRALEIKQIYWIEQRLNLHAKSITATV